MLSGWRTALQGAILGVMTGFAPVGHAEYYLYYPEPVITNYIEYQSPVKHIKHKKHHANARHVKSKSSYHISVTYYWPVCPGCTCASTMPGCYPNDEQLNAKAVTGHFVTISGELYPVKKQRSSEVTDESFDQRTSDDDVLTYPNMNNQYNMY